MPEATRTARVQESEQEVSFVSKPVPDPTERTTQQLYRAIEASQKQTETHIDGTQAVISTRIDAMDRAIILAQTSIDKFPAQILAAVRQLAEILEGKIQVVNERFKSIETQFVERDTRTEQTSRDSKVAVDAALQAAKEAVGEQNKSSALAISKSEAATNKQLDAIAILIQSNTKNIDDKIDDIKTGMSKLEHRINGIEARKEGATETKSGVNATLVITIAALSGAVGLIMAIFAIFHH